VTTDPADQVDQPGPTVAELEQRIADLEAVADRRLIELRYAARQLYATEVRRQSLGWTAQSTEDLIAIQHRLARAANEAPRPDDHFEHCARALARQLQEVSIEVQAGPPGWVQLKSWVPDKVDALLAQDPVAELLADPVLTAVSEAAVAGTTVIHTAAYEAVARAVDREVCDKAPTAASVRSATRLLDAIDRRPEIPRPLTFIAGAGGLNLEWTHVDDRCLTIAVDNDGTFTLHRFGIERRMDGTDEGAIWHEDRPAYEVEQIAELLVTLELPHEKLQMGLGQIPEVLPAPATAPSDDGSPVVLHPSVYGALAKSHTEMEKILNGSGGRGTPGLAAARSASELLDALDATAGIPEPQLYVSGDHYVVEWRPHFLDPSPVTVTVDSDGTIHVEESGAHRSDRPVEWDASQAAEAVAVVLADHAAPDEGQEP
jgi:hypothetical protein